MTWAMHIFVRRLMVGRFERRESLLSIGMDGHDREVMYRTQSMSSVQGEVVGKLKTQWLKARNEEWEGPTCDLRNEFFSCRIN